MLPSWDGGTPLLSSARSLHQAWLLLQLLLSVSMPPLELAFPLPLPDCVVVVSILGSKGPTPLPAFVGRHARSSRWREADAKFLHPLPANTLHHPWKYYFLTPPPLSRRSSNSWAMCSGGTTPRLLCARHRCSARGWHGDTGGLGGGFVGRIASVGGVSWSLVLDGWLALVQEGEGSSSVRGNPPP